MKSGKAAVAAGLLVAGCLGACSAAPAAGIRHQVALVGKSDTSEFFLSVYAGAQAAAAEYNVELTIYSPDTEEDYDAQNQLVEDAVASGAEALVYSAVDFENNAAVIDDAARQGVKIVAIDSNVDSDAVQTYIGTDNYAAGQMAAQAALDGVEGSLQVGIVNYDVSSANGQEREQGAVEAFQQSGRVDGITVINTLAEAGQAQADTAALLLEHPDLNVILAFNEPTSVGAANAVRSLEAADRVFLVGFDSNVSTIDGLQDGTVDALVVQNPYAMGYLGVESACRLLGGQGTDLEKTVDTATRIVNRDNMFTMDSQKVLFAFEQR